MPTVYLPRNETADGLLAFATGLLQGKEERRRRDEDIGIDKDKFDRRMGQDQTQFEESQNRADARQESSQTFTLGMDALNEQQEAERDAREQRQTLEQEQRNEEILDRRRVSEQKAAQEAVEWEVNFRGQQEMEKLNAATMDVMFDPRLSSEERDYALKQIEAKRRGIQPMPVLNKGPKYPEGQGVGEVWRDPSGASLTRDKDGTPKLLLKPDERPGINMTFPAYIEAYNSLVASMTIDQPSGEEDSEGVPIMTKVAPKPEDVEKMLNARITAYQRLVNGQKIASLDADMIGEEIDQASEGGGMGGGGPQGGGSQLRGPGMTTPKQFMSPKIGRPISMEEIEHTAQKRNLTIAQVLAILGIDPSVLTGQAGPPAGVE